MKNFTSILILIATAIFFYSCQDMDEISGPIVNEVDGTSSFAKSTQLDLPDQVRSKNSMNNSDYSDLKFSKKIDGAKGGIINFSHNYKSDAGNVVLIVGTLRIPRNAFSGTENISITLNTTKAEVDFERDGSGDFNTSLFLNLGYHGVDLDCTNSGDWEFGFIDEDNSIFEIVNYSNKKVDCKKGKLIINKAEIPHFSRFGWLR